MLFMSGVNTIKEKVILIISHAVQDTRHAVGCALMF